MSELHRAIETEIRDARSILEALAALLSDPDLDVTILTLAKAIVRLNAIGADLQGILEDLEQAAGQGVES